MAAALSALVEIICVERIANALSMVLYIYGYNINTTNKAKSKIVLYTYLNCIIN